MDEELKKAIRCGDVEKVNQSLASKLPQTALNGSTHLAVTHGHYDVVDTLLAHHTFDLLKKDREGRTALDLAVQLGHDRIVSRLIAESQAAIVINCLRHAKSPSQLLSILLKLYETLDPQFFPESDLVLQYAVKDDHKDMVEFLVSKVASMRERDATNMLQHAIKQGYDDVVKRIVEKRPLPPFLQGAGLSIFHFAINHKCENAAKMLFDAMPGVESKTDQFGLNALHLAVRQGMSKLVANLLDRSPGLVNVQEKDGSTALSYAARSMFHNCVITLLDYGALVDEFVFWQAVNHAYDDLDDQIVQMMFEKNPGLIDSVDKSNLTLLSRVFGLRPDRKNIYSQALMRTMWDATVQDAKFDPATLMQSLGVAIEHHNESAILLLAAKLPPEVVIEAVDKHAFEHEFCDFSSVKARIIGHCRKALKGTLDPDLGGAIGKFIFGEGFYIPPDEPEVVLHHGLYSDKEESSDDD